MLSCPVCQALVHAATLKDLAALAETQTSQGKIELARDSWQRALDLLPSSSRQHAVVQ